MALRGTVVILQHPFERKKNLATVPILELCLEQCLVFRHRVFPPGRFPALDTIIDEAEAARIPLLLLFPGPDSVALDEIGA